MKDRAFRTTGLVLNKWPMEWLMPRNSNTLPSNTGGLRNSRCAEVKLKVEK